MSRARNPRLTEEQAGLMKKVLRENNLTQRLFYGIIGIRGNGIMTGVDGIRSEVALRMYETLGRDPRLSFLQDFGKGTPEDQQMFGLFHGYNRKIVEDYFRGSRERRHAILQGLATLLDGALDSAPQPNNDLMQKVFDLSISDIGLDVRSRNALGYEGVETIDDVLQYTRYQLLAFRHLGKKSVRRIEAALSKYGLSLKPETAEK